MPEQLRFDAFEIRPAERLLLHDGRPVHLGGRAFDLLLALVRHRGRLLTKDDLLRIAWPGRIVEEANIQVQVSLLRKIIGHHAIATITGSGYRFTAELRDEAQLAETNRPADAGLPLRDQPSIAVLPFANLSASAEVAYLADGLAEDIITRLSRFKSLFVIARSSGGRSYRDKPVDFAQIGRALGVRYIIEGSIRRLDNRIRLNARLVDSIQGHHLWADTYDRTLDDAFAVQEDITSCIVAATVDAVSRRRSRAYPGRCV